jgi:dTDP-4-dehydrorhamnose 3,5-epimerase
LGSLHLKPSFTKISNIHHPKGDLYKVLRKSSDEFLGFGEAYFTTVIQGETKGWKKHREMYLNLTVPVGIVKFYIYNQLNRALTEFTIGRDNYGRLFIPPGYWVAFSGVGSDLNLILNIGSIEHDPSESEVIGLEEFPVKVI